MAEWSLFLKMLTEPPMMKPSSRPNRNISTPSTAAPSEIGIGIFLVALVEFHFLN